jgi:excisionase family DNA binding protein
MPELTIAEASARLGISPDTVRRRIGRGELPARKVPTAHGESYVIDLPEEAAAPGDPPAAGEPDTRTMAAIQVMAADLRKTIAILEGELAARSREIHELHTLLQHAQALALPAGQRQDRQPWWRRLFFKGF